MVYKMLADPVSQTSDKKRTLGDTYLNKRKQTITIPFDYRGELCHQLRSNQGPIWIREYMGLGNSVQHKPPESLETQKS